MQTKVLLFSHTHWDREWYRTFQEFRFGLVEVIDQILNLLQAGEYDYFILDGQTIVLEDYLEIRPDLKEKLAKWIKKGKLIVGPWYILPDEFLVSGESLIRNLLIGIQIANDFGKCQTIGYLPDMFGHIAQMPQILKGFNIDKAIVWRGVNPKKTIFKWQGLDKSTVLTSHLSDGYYNTFLINYENQKKDLETQLNKLKPHAFDNIILFPNGGDHLAPPQDLKEVIDDINKNFPDYKFIQSTLEEYFNNIKTDNVDLETIVGELRDPERAYILPAVFSARNYLKQRNYNLQNLLTNWVEPLSVISTVLGNEYNKGFVNLAWKYLLQNQPHDSICGCSTDQVHREMIPRYDSGEQICTKLIKKAMENISKSLPLQKDNYYIILFNTSDWDYTNVQRVTIDFLKSENVETFKLIDEDNNEIPYQLLSKTDMKKFVSEIDVLPDWIEIRRFEIILELNKIKSLGFNYLKVQVNEEQKTSIQKQVNIEKSFIENSFVKVFIENNNLVLEDKINDERFLINNFKSMGDAGDEYNYSPPQEDLISEAKIINSSIYFKNDLESILKVDYEMSLPISINDDRKSMKDEKVINKITSFITIKANNPIVYFKTDIDNKASDHKTIVSFSSGVNQNHKDLRCIYDTQFGLLEKDVKENDYPYDMEKYKERVEETFAIQNFADLSTEKSGITLITNGIPETEITKDKYYQLSSTLLRSVGWLSRDDLRTRGGGAGPAMPTPDAQCLGLNSFEYALYTHKNSVIKSDVINKVTQYSIGIKYIQYKPEEKSNISIGNNLLNLNPDKLIRSALKVSEEQDGIILRFYNPMPSSQIFKIKPSEFFDFSDVSFVDFNEKTISKLTRDNSNSYSGDIKPYEIISLKFSTGK
ncbi:MAG: glycoside hydrolase family 38 C-terminal domain-containing protein [Candidatus Sericytochromatia bacterium]